jgi:Holliday junction DNA helicase RuvA
MIAQITGNITYKGSNFLLITTNGIGYKVYVPHDIITEALPEKDISLWTHLVVREHEMELYGFREKKELDFFELLIGISGIGPKSALSILNLADVSKLKQAILSGDASYLTKVSGIGKKSAAKIILELKDRIKDTSDRADGEQLRGEEDTLDALTSLGYSTTQARDALRNVNGTDLDTGEKIKAALNLLSR